jgi:hypothetical protein
MYEVLGNTVNVPKAPDVDFSEKNRLGSRGCGLHNSLKRWRHCRGFAGWLSGGGGAMGLGLEAGWVFPVWNVPIPVRLS